MSIPYFDTHCDTISECFRTGKSLRENDLHVDLVRATASFAPYAQFFSVWGRPLAPGQSLSSLDFTKPDAPADALYKVYRNTIALLRRELAENDDIATLCLSAEDAKRAAGQGKAATFILVEGAELLGEPVHNLPEAYELGVRVICLNWNFDNALSGASRGAVQGGLTQEGRRFVKEAQRLGILLDLSHASDAAFWDVVAMTERPIIAGHSNARAVCGNLRNLTNEMYRAIVKLGGLAGINFNPAFLGGKADIDAVVRHIEHFLSLGGEKAVCLGGDLDGVTQLPEGIRGVQDMGMIYERLLRMNYSEDLCRGIFYGNTLAVMERSL